MIQVLKRCFITFRIGLINFIFARYFLGMTLDFSCVFAFGAFMGTVLTWIYVITFYENG